MEPTDLLWLLWCPLDWTLAILALRLLWVLCSLRLGCKFVREFPWKWTGRWWDKIIFNVFQLRAHWEGAKTVISWWCHQHLNTLTLKSFTPDSCGTPADHWLHISMPWHMGWKSLSYDKPQPLCLQSDSPISSWMFKSWTERWQSWYWRLQRT